MKKVINKKRKIRYFSLLEFFSILVASLIVASLPGILYGAEISLLWNDYTLWYVLYWAIVAGALCIVTAIQKYRTYEKPIQLLSDAAKKVANGDFSVFIEPLHALDKLDYIDAMFDDFNKMVAELGSIETMKNDFVSNVSHEIKTPLSVIKNYTTALKKPNLSPETREEYTDTIISACDKLSGLVVNVLKLNRLENQQISSVPEPFDLCKQLCECAINFESLWEEKQITFNVEIEDRAIIVANESLLELVWNNLLSNALKFTATGGTVTLKQTSDAHTITVSVCDTGCGMSEAALKHIFDKFYQADSSHNNEGNGLGLALAQRIIQQLGGDISVTSSFGKGSNFVVTLFI